MNFKQSPLGSMPDTWTLVQMKDIATKIRSGATPSGGESAYLPQRQRYALIRSQNVFDRYFDETGLAFISDEQASGLSGAEVMLGDLLINITGDGVTFARSCLVPATVLPACVNQHVMIIRVDAQRCEPGYLLSYLTHPNAKPYIESFNAGGSRRAITKGHIESFEVPLPPLPTQRRIADILSVLDDKIELNRQTNATLEAMAQAIFKEWFVDFNYPGATGELIDSELGLIPVGWRVGKLGDIYRTTSGGTPSRTNPEFYLNGTIQWVKSKEINGSFIIDTEEKITEEALKRSSAKLLPPYSVLIAMYGATVGEYGVVGVEATCNQAICAFLPNEHYPFTFIFHILKNNKDEIISRAVGSAQQNISQDTLKRFEVVLPPISLIQAFHKITNPIFQSIENNIRESSSLEQVRNELLPKLMSGEIWV